MFGAAAESPSVLPRCALATTDDHLARDTVAQLAEGFFAGRVSYPEFVAGVHEHPDPDVEALYDLVEHAPRGVDSLNWVPDERDVHRAPIRAAIRKLRSAPVGGAR